MDQSPIDQRCGFVVRSLGVHRVRALVLAVVVLGAGVVVPGIHGTMPARLGGVGRPELIDHIFVSRALLILPPTVTTLYPAGASMPSIDDNPDQLRNLPGSDHASVIATLTI